MEERLFSLWVPDKNGKLEDIVLGYDSLEQYLTAICISVQ